MKTKNTVEQDGGSRRVQQTVGRLLCVLFGHKVSENYINSGYHVCLRCGAHEYWDNGETSERWWRAGYLIQRPAYRLSFWFYNIKRDLFYRCHDCGKLERLFFIDIGNHDNCLPF